MAVGVAELARAVFLVAFYVWLFVLAFKALASFLQKLYRWLCDEDVRERLTATAIGRAFFLAFFPFGSPRHSELTPLTGDFLDENRRLCEWKFALIRGLEQKAVTQVAAAGIILALLATMNRVDLSIVWKMIPLIALLVAAAAFLKAAYLRTNDLAGGIIAAGAWQEYSFELDAVNTAKTRYVKTGNFWLVAALIFTVGLAFVPGSANVPAQGTLGMPAPNDLNRNLHVP